MRTNTSVASPHSFLALSRSARASVLIYSLHRRVSLHSLSEVVKPFFSEIDKRVKLAGLSDLRASALAKGDREIRVWSGFGIIALQGFVIRQSSGKWSALHLKSVSPNSLSSEYQERADPPRLGWDQMWSQLIGEGLLTLPDAAEIDCDKAVTDGISYAVELNVNNAYRAYHYDNPQEQKCAEAKHVMKIDEIIRSNLP